MRVSDGVEDLVAQRIRDWEIRQRVPQAAPTTLAGTMPVVTLSRELGSGGNEVAQAVCSALGWDLWDRHLVEELAHSAKVRTQVVDSVDEHTRGQILAAMQELLGEPFGEITYRRHLAEVILTIARHGKAVVVGRGTNFLLPQALNVRIIAPMPQRVERLALREGISPREAERRCRASDRERADFVRGTFGRDIADPLAYDLVINTAQLPPPSAGALVIAGVKERFGG